MRSFIGTFMASACCLLSYQSLSSSVDAFQTTISSRSSQAIRLTQRQQQQQLVRLQNSKEDEIAKLEEQLQKLKDDAATYIDQPSEEEQQAPSEPVEEVPIELFLSEQWKEQEAAAASEEGGGSLTTIIAGVGLALFLALFSQVPVGQEDLSKYSAIKAPTEQIDLGDLNRARSSGDL